MHFIAREIPNGVPPYGGQGGFVSLSNEKVLESIRPVLAAHLFVLSPFNLLIKYCSFFLLLFTTGSLKIRLII